MINANRHCKITGCAIRSRNCASSCGAAAGPLWQWCGKGSSDHQKRSVLLNAEQQQRGFSPFFEVDQRKVPGRIETGVMVPEEATGCSVFGFTWCSTATVATVRSVDPVLWSEPSRHRAGCSSKARQSSWDHPTTTPANRFSKRCGVRVFVRLSIETVVDVVFILILAFAITRLPSPSGRIIAAAGIGLGVIAWTWARWRRFRRLPRREEKANGE